MTETSGDVVMRGLPWSFGYNVSASRARATFVPPPPPPRFRTLDCIGG